MSDKLEKTGILLKNKWLSDVKIVAESESTQKDAKLDAQANCLYLTEQQTATYGRFGRHYFSAKEGGIYMSLSLFPESAPENWPDYTLLTGAAVVSAIERLTDKSPQIKWVNDIYLGQYKIAGILAEAVINTERANQVVIGVGINFNISEFPEEIAHRAGSLFQGETPTVSRSALIAEIWSEFHRLYKTRTFFDFYKAHSFILGKEVEFIQNGTTYSGQALDLTPRGELIVQLENGEKKILSSGEISLKKWT